MCGIVGYVGQRAAQSVLVDGLRTLEYRGYDSAGLAIVDGDQMQVAKAQGKLSRLTALLDETPLPGNVGIGHTRWATHGVPSDANAHPHSDPTGDFVVVHNGIIENYLALKEHFVELGHDFGSDTDTEVLAYVIAEEYDGDLKNAVRKAMARATGAYALVAMTAKEPGRIVAARMISPLIVGLGSDETFLASDIPAVLPYTNNILVVEDGEIVDVTADGANIETLDGTPVERDPFVVDWDPGRAEKNGYDHFMLKEIYEQPDVIEQTIGGRISSDGSVELDGVDWGEDFAVNLEKIWI
ncbi:MAG TPA: glutamine--fructose-6-phosphate aminotransferase, partial [Actinobacteria bacterium]|nr:glutamine--fructose-6-phosphate aminotransferase [Actinomycetota bacterium]